MKDNLELTKAQVQAFLNRFHAKMKVFGILYRDDRAKNRQTLQELELIPSYRRMVIESLTTEDYVDGPVMDTLYKVGEMWVFGKDVKGREVYIKLMLSAVTGQSLCISFHLAEHPLHYPLKL
ncbi:MAG: type II toxin-antitoxin system MqsR family toxin [Bacteroidales bacterium]|nr:type II toxin-antitoxin system MqsR family toxin [Bacteroidales bacterium]